MNPAPSPRDADRSAAHELLSELRTRIATQPLPYQHGVEARALESLWEIFGLARAAMKKYPGCTLFARKATKVLNVTLRPVTAKWHRAHAEGRLNSRDGADAFRGELKQVQEALRDFAAELHDMAYGEKHQDDLTPPAVSESEIADCFKPLAFGIAPCPAFQDHDLIRRINGSEREEILKRRQRRGTAGLLADNAVGLALSGGGIRSATFCLGVVQALAERGLLDQVDYLSTVSGGGYTGSFLTRRLGEGPDTRAAEQVARPQGPDPEAVRYVRQHAEFLSPASVWDSWGMITATLAGMLLNATVPLLALTAAALLTCLLSPRWDPSFWSWILGSSAGLACVGGIAYAVLLRGSRDALRAGAWILGVTAGLGVLSVGAWCLQRGFHTLPGLLLKHGTLTGALGTLVAAIPVTVRFLPSINTPAVRAVVIKVLLVLAGFIVPAAGVLLFYLLCYLGGITPNSLPPAWGPSPGHPWILGILAAVLGFIALLILDINRTSPHRIYRNRLARTFVSKSPSDDADVPLFSVNPDGKAPYHLVNTTLNVPSSSNPYLRDRKCDFFLFSKHWSGAPSVGYLPTERWRPQNHPIDLATVMAISGAAASSHMGLASMPTVSALLTLLNVRLGFWIHHPERPEAARRPGFDCLFKEMTGTFMTESASWLNLSDGGHIENTGIYELLRRRCKFIIAVDAEADPAFRFPGLMTLVRHARIDFGIRLEPDLEPLRPQTPAGNSPAHAVLCRIHYPAGADSPMGTPETLGLLLYLKLSVTGNESELIRRYRTSHPDFPHQSTADQFFDQEQFEAYRQLGTHVAEGLFASALMNSNPKVTTAAERAARCRPTTIEQWFKQLAESLLAPAS